MKSIIISIIFIFSSIIIFGQSMHTELYKSLAKFYFYKGCNIDTLTSEKEIIEIKNLIENTNTNKISIFYFSSGHDSFFNIIMVENDNIDIYDIHALNEILNKIVDLSRKYNSIVSESITIKWIEKTLYLNKLALNESVFTSSNLKKTEGKVTFHYSKSTINPKD